MKIFIVLFVFIILSFKLTETKKVEYAIALHGGAGVISPQMPDSIKNEYLNALDQALKVGEEILKKGGTSLEAVKAVVITLENDPKFNAGKGAVYTIDGEHELDAGIMDGYSLSCGSVTGVKTVKNPILLAEKVMTDSKHVMFAGSGAEKFADLFQLERVENNYFDTQKRYEQWLKNKKGTVGCVALDKQGNLAAATSTGGMTNKQFGRVGDCPIIGAGTYANNKSVAVSATGTGEEFIRHGVAKTISDIIIYGNKDLKFAADELIFKTLKKGDGGVICIDKEGQIYMPFNSVGMFRAAANSNGYRDVKIWN